MYSPSRLIIKFIRYYLGASSGKGHGIHSPFVFEFVKKVLAPSQSNSRFEDIELNRKKLLQDNAVISVRDFGAGSAVIKTNDRVVRKIAGSSLKSKKVARLLYRMVLHYKPSNIIELGTSFGITTSYMAIADNKIPVYTVEGDPSIASIASNNFATLQLDNINLTVGNFDEKLPELLEAVKAAGLVFIDGNHRKTPTLKYFGQLLPYANESTIIILDDIHWSAEMEEAWNEIKQSEQVTLSIDLFFIGIVFFKNAFKVKQHFSIRF